MSRLLPQGAEPPPEEGLVSCLLIELGWGGVRGGEVEAPKGAWRSPPDLLGCREGFSGLVPWHHAAASKRCTCVRPVSSCLSGRAHYGG